MRDYFIVFGLIIALFTFVTFVVPNLGDGYGRKTKQSGDKNGRS